MSEITKRTSRESFMRMKLSGQISVIEFEILALMGITVLPMCTAEIDRKLGRSGSWKRMAALQRKGLVTPAGTTMSPDTGREVTTWALTGADAAMDRGPKPNPPRENTRKEILRLRRENEDQRSMIAALEKRLERWGRPSNAERAARRDADRTQPLPLPIQ